MGIFSKKQIRNQSNSVPLQMPEPSSSEEYNQHREKIDNHFEKRFDLNSIRGINAIPVKEYHYLDEITGRIDYVLRMKAGVHATNKRMDLAIACLRKAQEIMPKSPVGFWQERDYMRLVSYLIQDGQFDEARAEWNRILNGERGIITDRELHNIAFDKNIDSVKELGADLVRMSESYPTCAECSKYQGRVYSLSGKDRRFPKLPEQFIVNHGVHDGCRHSIGLYWDGVSTGLDSWEGIGPVAFSNRPFKDYRPPQEVEEYEKRKNEKRFVYDEEWFESEKCRYLERKLYEKICETLPDIAPKSYSGYMRMKNANTKNYLKLVEAAKQHGISIEE